MYPVRREKSEMSTLAEASMLVRTLAEPRPAGGDSVKAAVQRAARKLHGWTANRVQDVWDADPRVRISADEMDRLRAAARRDRQEESEAHDAFQLVLARLDRIEALLKADQDAVRQVDAEVGSRVRVADRAMDR